MSGALFLSGDLDLNLSFPDDRSGPPASLLVVLLVPSSLLRRSFLGLSSSLLSRLSRLLPRACLVLSSRELLSLEFGSSLRSSRIGDFLDGPATTCIGAESLSERGRD